MLELIDREHFISIMHGKQKYTSDAGYFEALQFAIEKARELPKIEPGVKHAHWTNDTFCSNCSRFPIYQGAPISSQELAKYFSYCPYCGAKMDGDD